ncbi:MAG: enoyl-CoA hydratase-related protein, partial [Casimicrobiaceae bacterium]
MNALEREATNTMDFQHFKLRTDAEGIVWVGIDVAGASVNTLGAPVRAEVRALLERFEAESPKAVVFYSEKPSGFVAGADVGEFQTIAHTNDAQAAKALVIEGYDMYERLAAARYPTLALIRGFCMGGGLELALACRYRVAVDEPATKLGLPEVMLGILPGWGGVKRLPQVVGAPAALDLMLTGKTVDARRAKALGLVDEAVPYRIMWNTARGLIAKAPRVRKLPFLQNLLTNGPFRGLVAAQAEKQVARRARREHYPAPYAIIELWKRYDGDIRKPAPSEACSLETLLNHPTARNLIRVFGLREALKAQAKGIDFKAAHVHVVGAGVMGGDIAAWCALRGLRVTLEDLDAARIAPAIQRAHALYAKRLRDPRRIRDAMDL